MLAPDRALDLKGTHALFGFAEQQRDHEPSSQRKMGVMEDGADCDAKLILAFRAPEQLELVSSRTTCVSCNVGTRAFRPAQPFQQFAAFIIGSKHFSNLRESHREYPI